MGWGGKQSRGHAGNKSKGHGHGSQTYWKPSQHHHDSSEDHTLDETIHVAVPVPWPLAAQWRFASRILRRYAPEEKVHDIRRQVRLGDHVFVQYSWDFAEQHGIICSASGEDAHGRHADRQESHWVVHWDNSSRVQCISLSQFSKGGELFRVDYPHWLCQVILPSSSTMKPHVVDERCVEGLDDAVVAKQADSAYHSGSWTPQWGQAHDLEFCLATKTGIAGPQWELHGRKTLSSVVLVQVGCAVRGERRPSDVFGSHSGEASGHVVSASSSYYHGGGVADQSWMHPGHQVPAPAPHQMLSVSELEAFQHEKYATNYTHDVSWGSSSWDSGWQNGYQSHAMPYQQPIHQPIQQPIEHPTNNAHSSLSASAEVFVPRSSPSNWDGIYQ
mmetsp:Transcript_125428/g.354811  ORF Transcript_125428/g.354811 Transcript_125428/m.354811 type:complete len:387 (+) Transcript_125428:23-1183(+)|eukprot:CAMPEP_0179272586 /NCGR_PEP_ID=MMETSP0797-20121207/32578_1 /TAXON_ID=47934 /ORGANISM="Dinophysis acuminata, Strain DAEP01" /LENGTH=386 /DNA_ID=CAMNT_0020980995 /DNA_START=23 /DNA_END=1183 /DNA_ORIENTATION=-